MTKADYIRQVDAMALPHALQQRLEALARARAGLESAPTAETGDGPRAKVVPQGSRSCPFGAIHPPASYRVRGERATTGRPYGRWAAIAAALVLVVGLWAATPTLIHLFTTGGDITNPPPVTTSPSISDPWGLRLYAEDVTSTGLTLFFAQSGGTAAGKLMTGPVFWVERYEDGQWALLNTGTRNWTTEAYPITRGDLTEFSEDWTSIYGALPSGRYRLGKNVMNFRGPGDYDEQRYYAEFTIESSPAPILSDDELTELLAAESPLEKTPEDTLELLYSTASESVTMGVLEYVGVNEDGLRRGFLILGAFDNATAHPSGQIQLFGGTPFESREMLPYSTNESESGDGYFLCIRQNTGATPSSVYYYPTIYRFDGRAVTPVTASPNASLPEGMEDMFDSTKNEDFWQQHKIIVAPGGFELFRRNPDWNRPDMEQQPLWVYDAYVPLAHEFPDPRVMAEARSYFVDYYKDDMAGSSYYSIQRCELVPDYGVAFYGEDSSAYRVVLEDYEGGLERYFVFDGNMELLNVATSDWVSPWDSYEGRLSQISVKGVPIGGLFNELDESIRATLVDTGETEDLSVTQPGMVAPWILKIYRSASLEVVTATASEDVLEQRLAEGDTITRERYDRVSGVEFIHRVRPLDGTYATEGSLRIGDSVERARKLFYNLPETGEQSYNSGMDGLSITTENGVVTDMVSQASTRTMGDGIFY